MILNLLIRKLFAKLHLIYFFSINRLNIKNVSFQVMQYEIADNILVYQTSIVSLSRDGTEKIGFSGSSLENQYEANIKAFNEYLEFLFCWEKNILSEDSRSGCSVGPTIEFAIAKAYEELVERDSFLMHMLVPKLKTLVVDNSDFKNEFEEKLFSVELQTVDPKVKTVMSGIRLKNEKWLIGLGASPNLKDSLLKSVLEIRNLYKSWRKKSEPSTFFIQSLYHFHYEASSTTPVVTALDMIFGGRGSEVCSTIVDVSKLKIVYKYDFSFKNKAVYVKHIDLIPISFGNKWLNEINVVMRILETRNLKGNWLIHPLI